MKRFLTAMTLTLLFSSAVAVAEDTASAPAAPAMADSSADTMKMEGTKGDAVPQVKASKKIHDEAPSVMPAEEKKPKKKKRKKRAAHHEEPHASESHDVAPAADMKDKK